MSTDGEVTVFCVGLGRQFAGHLSSALAQHRSNVLVGGLCDIRPDQCESIRRYLLSLGISFSRSAVYTEDFAFLLEHAIRCRDEHPGRYMFIVSTGAETHFTLCELCLRNGFHVYVDKPFVLNVRDGEQLVALADAQGIAIGVGAQRRFESVYRRLLVEAREIGQIRRIHFHHHGNFAQFDPNSPEGNVIPTGFGYHAVDTVAWLLHELYFGDPDLRLIGAVVRKWENNREYHQSFDSLFVCDTNDGPNSRHYCLFTPSTKRHSRRVVRCHGLAGRDPGHAEGSPQKSRAGRGRVGLLG